MSSFSLKKMFENKSSLVTFNESTRAFEIEDNAKWQVLFLRIIMLGNGFLMIISFLRLEHDTISYFLLIFGVSSIAIFILSLFTGSSKALIFKDEIRHANYKKGANAQVNIKLTNGRNRNLYIFQKEAAQVIVELLETKNVQIKEKTSWLF